MRRTGCNATVAHCLRNCRKNYLVLQIGYGIHMYFKEKGAALELQSDYQDRKQEEGIGKVSPAGLVPEWTLTACLTVFALRSRASPALKHTRN